MADWYSSDWAWVDPVLGAQNASHWVTLNVPNLVENVHFISLSPPMLETTIAGDHDVFAWRGNTLVRVPPAPKLGGNNFRLSTSSDGKVTVFENQALDRLPELYVVREHLAQRLAHANEDLASKLDFHASRVAWKSSDGTLVDGWILRPKGRAPYPLLTFVHGGPGVQITNGFAPYTKAWPYPFESLAAHGIGVFFPNFRGTGGYGRAFARWHKVDREPVSDIETGIDSLVREGMADPTRLGLAGQSYGAVIGPLVLTRTPKRFQAASFAEGVTNEIVWYRLTSGEVNRSLGTMNGVPVEHNLQEYLRISSDMHFDGIAAKMLLETGAFSNVMPAFGEARAAMRANIGTELIVYPNTGHNLEDPVMRRESLARNLEWFAYWLRSVKNPDSGKAAQYDRWSNLSHSARANDAP